MKSRSIHTHQKWCIRDDHILTHLNIGTHCSREKKYLKYRRKKKDNNEQKNIIYELYVHVLCVQKTANSFSLIISFSLYFFYGTIQFDNPWKANRYLPRAERCRNDYILTSLNFGICSNKKRKENNTNQAYFICISDIEKKTLSDVYKNKYKFIIYCTSFL